MRNQKEFVKDGEVWGDSEREQEQELEVERERKKKRARKRDRGRKDEEINQGKIRGKF